MKTFIYWVVCLVVVVGVILGLMQITKKDASIPEIVKYSDEAIGLEFDYEVGQDGYVLSEIGEEDPDIIKNITLMRVIDSENMSSDPDFVGEGPAVISINVFENTAKQFPLSWAMENNAYSNYNLKIDENLEMVVGGANAIGYSADGLYPSQNIVVAHGSYMYVFTGQYMEAGNKMHKDFSNLINSIKFIPTASQVSGKINIDLVCEGALSYMTFSSGEEADKFVLECKEGKHPEVIDRYKSDMGIQDDRVI